MTDWQKLLHERSLRSLKQLVDKFGAEHFPDLGRLQQAADNFEFRISPAMVDLIKEPGDPIWRQPSYLRARGRDSDGGQGR